MKRYPEKIDNLTLAQFNYLKALNKKFHNDKTKDDLLQMSLLLLDKLIPEHDRLLTQIKMMEK